MGAKGAAALKAESGSCQLSLGGASMHPHTGVQGQCCSGAVLGRALELCFQHHPHMGKGTVGECKSTICGDWMD